MLRTPVAFLTAAGAVAVIAGLATMPRALNAQQSTPHHRAPAAKNGNVVVMLCDGKTSMEIKGLKPGQRMSHDQAMGVSRKLMDTWQREHPGERWEMAQEQNPPPAGQAPEEKPASAQSGPANRAGSWRQLHSSRSRACRWGNRRSRSSRAIPTPAFTNAISRVWQDETQKFVAYGKQVFHSDKMLGGTIGVSCDMCHPDASNTHPETYPKYQVQLQRVALLRDMIEWCIENPVKGKTMDPNDERLRALEAYILAQRKGTPLDYGKH